MVYRRAYERHVFGGPASLSTKDSQEQPLLLKNLSGAGACVYGSYPFKMNELVTVTIKATSFFEGFFSKRVRVAWSKQVRPSSWEAGLDFLSNI